MEGLAKKSQGQVNLFSKESSKEQGLFTMFNVRTTMTCMVTIKPLYQHVSSPHYISTKQDFVIREFRS